jgi:hypothetical protein
MSQVICRNNAEESMWIEQRGMGEKSTAKSFIVQYVPVIRVLKSSLKVDGIYRKHKGKKSTGKCSGKRPFGRQM